MREVFPCLSGVFFSFRRYSVVGGVLRGWENKKSQQKTPLSWSWRDYFVDEGVRWVEGRAGLREKKEVYTRFPRALNTESCLNGGRTAGREKESIRDKQIEEKHKPELFRKLQYILLPPNNKLPAIFQMWNSNFVVFRVLIFIRISHSCVVVCNNDVFFCFNFLSTTVFFFASVHPGPPPCNLTIPPLSFCTMYEAKTEKKWWWWDVETERAKRKRVLPEGYLLLPPPLPFPSCHDCGLCAKRHGRAFLVL